MSDRLTPEREAGIAAHLATTTNWSIGNLAARDLAAELAAVRAERDQAQARVVELERPAIELKRNEIRLSYRQLAMQAREDRDYEGEATVLKQLADREEQWKREDAAGGGE